MTPIQIKKGLDIPLAGAPRPEIVDIPAAESVAVYQEFPGLKAKLRVAEGDQVGKGSPLFIDKKRPDLQFCSPVAGVVKAIEYGARRALYRIVIDVGQSETPDVECQRYSADQLRGVERSAVLSQLLSSGLFSLIRQRPFSRIADPEITPKSIFVNGMNTAPFLPDLNVVVQGQERAFQAGLDLMTRLTEGDVHLCVAPDAADSIKNASNVKVHQFSGPHPSGNTSIHIHHIDPMEPTDQVWTVRGTDLIRIGQLFLDGNYPDKHVISLGGPGVKEDARAHYRVQIGTPLVDLLDGRMQDGEQRVIKGDALAGVAMPEGEHVSAICSAITILAEGREQFFMGWMAPGINKLSASRAYLSGWNGHKRKWDLTTNTNGGYRAMVFTGLYDKYMPLNIMVDYLVRAVLAHDTDEAISLGILETDPEDFALCAYVCPSKMDISGVIRQGLEEIEKEGI